MKTKILILMAMLGGFLYSCKKEKTKEVASLQMVNAAVGFGALKVNVTGNPANFTTYPDSLVYTGNALRGVLLSTKSVEVGSSKSAAPITSISQEFVSGGMYSLYLAGQSPNLETILRKEEPYPLYNVADSAFAVRVINLISNSGPLKVTLSRTASVNEFEGLTYKQQSDFKKYPLKAADANLGYTFQLRDQTGSLLASYIFFSSSLQSARFKANTLVICGQIGGASPNQPKMILISNFLLKKSKPAVVAWLRIHHKPYNL